MNAEPWSSATPMRVPPTRVPSPRRFDVMIVVPARNEQDHIASSLTSILASARHASSRVERVAVVVVADGCRDATVDIARSVLVDRPHAVVTECDIGNVALVRALGVEVGRSLLMSRRADRTWIASTDADTDVPRDWIVQQMAAATRGLSAVAGVVDIVSFDGHPVVAKQHFADTYTTLLPVDGDHPHVHAANLGVRLDAYDRAGGWGCLARSEDRDLWNRLQTTGARVASPSGLRVMTSGRPFGRVPGGFAECLRQQVLDRQQRHSDESTQRSA